MISQIGKNKQKILFLESPAAMREEAVSLAYELKGGETVCLFGELGSGKTNFTQGLATGLKFSDEINSPTFNILKVYSAEGAGRKIKRLYHVDCYRLESPQDILDLGFKEWLADKNGVVVIEWADKIKSILPREKIDIRFEITGEKSRKISIAS